MMGIFYADIAGIGETGYILVLLEKVCSNVSIYFTATESEIPIMINLMVEYTLVLNF